MRTSAVFVFALTILSGAASAQDAAKGQEIYTKKCQSCHRLTDEMKNGPGLAGVTKRRTEEWLHKWLANPKAVIESGDAAAQAMFKKFKTKMPAIDLMQDEQNRKDMIAFLKTLEGN